MDGKVAIILVNYNGYADTVNCINSLCECTYNNIEIVVVDNNSTNDSVAHLRALNKDFVLIENDENRGFSAGNNIGIRYAIKKGAKYVVMLNADTTVEPDFIEELFQPILEDEGVGLVTGKILYYDHPEYIWSAGGSYSRIKNSSKHFGLNHNKDLAEFNKKREVTFCTGCLIGFKTSIVEECGYLNEAYFLYVEDVDFSLSVMDHGYKLIYAPKSVIYHKIAFFRIEDENKAVYYNCRNRLFLIKNYDKLRFKLVAYLFTYMSFHKISCLNSYNKAYIRLAKKDFRQNICGYKDLKIIDENDGKGEI